MGNEEFERRVREQVRMVDKPSLTDSDVKKRLANYRQRVARERRVADVYRSENYETCMVMCEVYERIAERRGIS